MEVKKDAKFAKQLSSLGLEDHKDVGEAKVQGDSEVPREPREYVMVETRRVDPESREGVVIYSHQVNLQ